MENGKEEGKGEYITKGQRLTTPLTSPMLFRTSSLMAYLSFILRYNGFVS